MPPSFWRLHTSLSPPPKGEALCQSIREMGKQDDKKTKGNRIRFEHRKGKWLTVKI
ncbi:hypothetical protein RBIBE_02300 [Bacillus velezensis]|nr:hypothetical protein RBIBE_02300 [Bacillus velezensis]GLZ65926.1 hypothetical protein Bamy02_29790 [Bacillus amyloliquefaciens]